MKFHSQSSHGSCCWAAFLKDGALRENSPNYMGCTANSGVTLFVPLIS